MERYRMNLNEKLDYHMGGKFEASNPHWVHMTRKLPDYELMVVTHGTLFIADDTCKYEIKKGHYILMNPTNFQHGYRSSDCKFYWLHFGYSHSDYAPSIISDSDDAPSQVDSFLQIPITYELSSPERVILLMRQLQDCDRNYHESNLNRYLTLSVLCELSNQCLRQTHSGSLNKKRLMNDITNYVDRYLSETIRVKDIADYFGYNEKYLTTYFRKQSGISLKTYLTEKKMERAKSLLCETNLTVTQIGYQVGYEDVHNFATLFKKSTGMSPSNYRNLYANGYVNQ